MQFLASKEEQRALREWLKDYIVSYITADGKRQRQVRDYFTKQGPGERFKTSYENWNTTPLEMKKFTFRTALEELKKDGLIRTDRNPRRTSLNHDTVLVVNDVLDIMAGIKK